MKNVGKKLTQRKLKSYLNCKECVLNPEVYITPKQIGVCEEHWSEIVDKDLQW